MKPPPAIHVEVVVRPGGRSMTQDETDALWALNKHLRAITEKFAAQHGWRMSPI